MKKILLSLALSAPAALALDGIYFQHQDWEIACDNSGTCRAAGYQDEDLPLEAEGYPEPVSLLLTRQAGADAAVRAELQIIPDIRDDKYLDTEAALTLNGKTLGSFTFSADQPVVQLDGKQTAAILAALPQKKAEIVLTAGERKMRLSDQGASAVLLKMDEFQQRIDTPSALIRKGSSGKAVLAPAPLPTIRAVIPQGEAHEIASGSAEHAQLMKHFAADFAEGAEAKCSPPPEGESPVFTLYPLGGGRVLSETACWIAAYNSTNHYAILTEDLQELLAYVYGSVASDDFNLNDYSAGQGRLSGSFKGRGIGDCWIEETLQYDGEAFRPSAFINHGMCKGFPGGAWDLPEFVSEVIEP